VHCRRNMRDAALEYTPRYPEATVLYRVVHAVAQWSAANVDGSLNAKQKRGDQPVQHQGVGNANDQPTCDELCTGRSLTRGHTPLTFHLPLQISRFKRSPPLLSSLTCVGSSIARGNRSRGLVAEHTCVVAKRR
jgi:hypothetical protein